MEKAKNQSVMIPKTLLARARKLAPLVMRHPIYGVMGRFSMASVVRLALALGLDILEEQVAEFRE